MNRIYKVIFNHALQVFQVVSELANGHPKSETPVGLKGRSFCLFSRWEIPPYHYGIIGSYVPAGLFRFGR